MSTHKAENGTGITANIGDIAKADNNTTANVEDIAEADNGITANTGFVAKTDNYWLYISL